MVGYHSHGPPTPFAPTLSPAHLYGLSEESSAKLALSHAVPHQWGDLPTTSDNPFELERSHSHLGNGSSYGTSPLPRPFGEGPSRSRVTGPSPSIPVLISPPVELGFRGIKRKLSNASLAPGATTQKGSESSGSSFITSVSPYEVWR